MKKIFTLAALLVLAMTVNAQGYRKWDFTNWSAATIANLQAASEAGGVTGGSWSDTEKADGSNQQSNKCYWSYGDNIDSEGNLKIGEAVIAETEGLVFNASYTSRRSLAIAVDYPSTSLGEYGGPQYLWLGGGNAKSASARIWCFKIPNVRIGQKITITAESHKPTDARGVSLFVGDCTNDELKIGESFTPKTLDSYTWEEGWTLPESYTAEGETVDIIVYNTNGCHIYSIEVGDNTQTSKAAFLYNGTLSEDLAYAQLSTDDHFTMEPIEATGAFTMETLAAYDAIVISSTMTNAEAIASLKAIQPFVPTLNLNPALYTAWGYGAIGTTGEQQFAQTNNPNHALFRGLDVFESDGIYALQITNSNEFKGVTLNDYFTNDEILATVMGSEDVAIHAHNLTHNGYLFIPYTQETLADAATPQLLNNAVNVLVNSKAKVTAAPKPTFELKHKDMNTDVIIKSTVPMAQIFYTLDGSEPTEQSTLYTEPVNIATEGVTVKAVAKGDGYLLGEVAEQAVDLKHQSAAPVISTEEVSGYTIVSFTCATEGVDIYYNYEASEDSTKSTKYTEPVILMTEKTISAFAVSSEFVQSEIASKAITITNPIVFTEQLSHMNADKDPYYDLFYNMENKPNSDSNSKVVYFFSWGKSKTAYPYYNTSADPIRTEVDPETGDEKPVYPLNPEEKFDFQNGWAVRSRGHVICSEITIKPGTDLGKNSTYNPATVDEFEFADYPVTNYYLNISEWNTADPRSGMIYSTQKFKGPFAVLSYISNGNAGTGPQVVFETGNDIDSDAVETEWTQIGDTCTLNQGQRLYKKFVRIYAGTDEVYLRTRIAAGGSKAGFYDIYVLAIDPASVTGIKEIATENETANNAKGEAVYSLNGVRLNTLQRGLNIVRQSDGTTKKVMMK